jgi:hypothetical protein
MSELDRIDARTEHLKERLVSAMAFAGASALAALAAGAWHSYLWLVSCGALGWAVLEFVRLTFAVDDRRQAVDRLVLAGSRDARCARRRRELASARTQHAVAKSLRNVCIQADARTPVAFRVVDPQTVHAVERELQELAATLDADAGHVPAEAVVRLRQLISSPESPLLAPHLDAGAKLRSIEDAERLIARCRADMHDA